MPSPGDERRRFLLACALGAAAATLLFCWLATAGRWDFTRAEVFSNFYDIQARSLLHGHWDVPAEPVGIEGIRTDGRTYLYFGPVPALLRMPLFAVTDELDGRLTAPSLVIAFLVAETATALLAWRGRRLVAGERPLGRLDLVAGGGLCFLVGSGSVLLFLGSRLLVYHEAIAWGVALSLASYDALAAYVEGRRPRALVAATVLATGAFLSRPSVGLGPVVALAGLAAWLGMSGLRRRVSWRRVAAAAAAVALPVVAFVAVNEVKFHSAFRLPLDRQAFTAINPQRQAALAANGGSLFGLRFVPTTLLHYARPDGVRAASAFPWLEFPPSPGVVGHVVFDTIDRAASGPATMPALAVLALVGVAAVARRRDLLRPFVLPLVGGAAGAVAVLTIAFIAHRYLADALPLLVVGSAVGVQVLVGGGLSSWPRRMALAGLIVLCAWSLVANLALALQYQRAWSPGVEPAVLSQYLGWQHALGSVPGRLSKGEAFPLDAKARDLFVVGDCAGLYWFDGDSWRPVERSEPTGRLLFQASVPPRPTGTVDAVVVAGETARFEIEYLARDRIRFRWVSPTQQLDSQPVKRPEGLAALETVADSRVHAVAVSVNGRPLLVADFVAVPASPPQLAPAFASSRRLPQPMARCRQISGTSS